MKKVASGKTVLYHYVGGNLIAETDGSGSTQRNYIYLNGQPAAVRIYGSQDGMYYFVNDHLGTPQKLVNSTGSVVWAAGYFPFGKAQIKPEIITNNLRFPGQYFDAESGLHYNWNRYYDPDTGRYITADPIGLAGGINLYSYALNNPVRLTDPDGQIVLADDAIIGLGMLTVATAVYLQSPAGQQAWSQIVSDIRGTIAPYLEASPGRQVDSGIEQRVTSIQSKAVLDGLKRPDRCKVLEQLIEDGEYTALQAKKTLKDWGCKHSRLSKDKCK